MKMVKKLMEMRKQREFQRQQQKMQKYIDKKMKENFGSFLIERAEKEK